mmetsp:Transcript_25810/g.56145  ORF Transcript_25810/g.56145 Transcript_25810/m.56145 type:complete len:82 (-) Transcript_25810:129-374(-)
MVLGYIKVKNCWSFMPDSMEQEPAQGEAQLQYIGIPESGSPTPRLDDAHSSLMLHREPSIPPTGTTGDLRIHMLRHGRFLR